MGSRGRSIRLRIYFLVAIPLIAMVGLLGYVVTTTVNNAVSLDRAPNLVNATAVPAAKFGTFVEAERTAAVVYLFQPSPANLQAYQAAIAATDKAKPAFTAAMTSEATVKTETADAAKIVRGIVTGMNQLPKLRDAVQARALTPIDALNFYSQGFGQQVKLFLIQTESVVTNDQQSQAVGLIATVQAREQLAQENALLAGMLAGHRMTQKDRVAFTNMAATRQADMAYANYILTPAYLAKYNAALGGSGSMQQDLAGIEQAIVAGTPLAKLRVTQAQWQHLAGTLLQDEFNGGVAVANAILAADHRISHAAWVRVGVAGGAGLLGLLLTILVSTLVGPRHHPPPGRPGAQRPPARRGPAAGRGGQAQARRERRRERRGAGAADRPRRDRPGGPGVRPGPADRHPGRGGRGPAAAGPQRRVPQPGPAQPVAAAPPARPAGPDGTAGHRPGGA